MRNRGTENYLVQALDDRIRSCVEQVLSQMLTRQSSVVRANGNGLAQAASIAQGKRPRGRPPRARKVDVEGKILKTIRTSKGSVIYTDSEKYLRRPNGATIKLSHVKDSMEPARAMGYSSAEYQLARRYRWPMPCPMDFQPPARHRPGRPGRTARN